MRREFDLVEKRFVDGGFALPAAKSRVAWLDRDALLVGSDFGPGSLTDSEYPRDVRVWRRGAPRGADAPVAFRGEASDVSVGGYVAHHRGHAYEWRSRSTSFYTSRKAVRRHAARARGRLRRGAVDRARRAPEGRVRVAVRRPDARLAARAVDADARRRDARGGQPARGRHRRFCRERAVRFVTLFAPSARCSLGGWTATRSRLVLSTLENVKSRLRFWEYDAAAASREGAPAWKDAGAEPRRDPRALGARGRLGRERRGLPHDQHVPRAVDARARRRGARRGDGRRGRAAARAARAVGRVARAAYQREATSADGTAVPYFVVAPAGAPRDGSTPTLLYGYGGFALDDARYLGAPRRGAARRGCAYAVANIRGGGEFGPSWHQAALREKRQAAYDDFAAVAEDLIGSGLTRAPRLAIRGGSNGGLLVGNLL